MGQTWWLSLHLPSNGVLPFRLSRMHLLTRKLCWPTIFGTSYSSISPRDQTWILFGIHSNLLSVDNDSLIVFLNCEWWSQMGWIVFQIIDQIIKIHEWVIDCFDCHLNICNTSILVCCSQLQLSRLIYRFFRIHWYQGSRTFIIDKRYLWLNKPKHVNLFLP